MLVQMLGQMLGQNIWSVLGQNVCQILDQMLGQMLGPFQSEPSMGVNEVFMSCSFELCPEV